MKGIILAGGSGSRLAPITTVVSKQLLPVYDKPMIYYPLSTLMEGGIKDILVISKGSDRESFEKLLSDGSQWGINISYATQDQPNGIAEAFVIGERFIGSDPVCLILGDNLFWTENIEQKIKDGFAAGYSIFSYRVSNPESFGVVHRMGNSIINIEEKPKNPASNEVSIGLYIYKADVCEVAKNLKPSKRLEFEITDVNNHYLNQGLLHCQEFKTGSAWLDTGTVEALAEAGEFVRVIQNRQGVLVGSPDEVALRKGWISIRDILNRGGESAYFQALKKLATDLISRGGI